MQNCFHLFLLRRVVLDSEPEEVKYYYFFNSSHYLRFICTAEVFRREKSSQVRKFFPKVKSKTTFFSLCCKWRKWRLVSAGLTYCQVLSQTSRMSWLKFGDSTSGGKTSARLVSHSLPSRLYLQEVIACWVYFFFFNGLGLGHLHAVGKWLKDDQNLNRNKQEL